MTTAGTEVGLCRGTTSATKRTRQPQNTAPDGLTMTPPSSHVGLCRAAAPATKRTRALRPMQKVRDKPKRSRPRVAVQNEPKKSLMLNDSDVIYGAGDARGVGSCAVRLTPATSVAADDSPGFDGPSPLAGVCSPAIHNPRLEARPMSSFTSFSLAKGGVVHVQSSLKPPGRPGTTEASGARDKAVEAWTDGLELVREVAEGVVAQLREATRQAERVTVEFGVNISGRTGIVLVEGTAAANLKVTISWKGQG
jgi:hypothetical protein